MDRNANTALTRTTDEDTSLQPASLSELKSFSETFAMSQLLPKHLRDRPADVALTVLYGRELGLTPMQAIQGIHVIEGKPSLSAAMAVALVKRSPLCDFFELVESSAKVATYETQRKGARSPLRMSFTIEEAIAAGLTGKDNWRKYPAAMLRSRAALSLARDVYPDVVANIISEDEADDLRGAPSPSFVAPPAAAVAPAPFKPPANTIEASAQPAPARAEAPAADAPLLARMKAAPDMAELVKLGQEAKGAPVADQPELRDAYAKRKAELSLPADGKPAAGWGDDNRMPKPDPQAGDQPRGQAVRDGGRVSGGDAKAGEIAEREPGEEG